jgi:hypothetical protein
MVVGILALIFYNDLIVKNYFANLNGQNVSAAPVPEPVIIEPVEQPILEEESPSPEEIEAPKPRKKSGPRKTA